MKALIFSGGSFSNLPPFVDMREYNLIIAADAGYLAARDLGIVPDVFIGDFDSVLKEEVKAKKIISLNPVKDMTDTQEAIEYAISQGAKDITLLGALGGRCDHTIANIHLLKYAQNRGACVKILDNDTSIMLVTDEITLSAKSGFCLSLLPLTDCSGVSVKGVYYPLDDAEMPVGNPYGISNEFVSSEATIRVKSGELLAILSRT